MAENFLDKAPVGTKIFNKGDKKYYVKVNLGDRTIWTLSRGSSITAGSRNLTKDEKGTTFKYKGETIEQGDNIPDYLQRDQWTGRELIQIKGGKYYTPAGEEHKGLKIGDRRGEVYTIEDFNSKTGIDLKNALKTGTEYRGYLKKNEKAINLKNKIDNYELLMSKGKQNLARQVYRGDISELKKQLKELGPIEPFKGAKPQVDASKFQVRPGTVFDDQAFHSPSGNPLTFPRNKLTITKSDNPSLKIGTA